MARTYQYICHRCSFDTLSGGPVYMCPHCGGDLDLVNVFHVEKPAQPDSIRMEVAIDDVIRGFEKLLGEQ